MSTGDLAAKLWASVQCDFFQVIFITALTFVHTCNTQKPRVCELILFIAVMMWRVWDMSVDTGYVKTTEEPTILSLRDIWDAQCDDSKAVLMNYDDFIFWFTFYMAGVVLRTYCRPKEQWSARNVLHGNVGTYTGMLLILLCPFLYMHQFNFLWMGVLKLTEINKPYSQWKMTCNKDNADRGYVIAAQRSFFQFFMVYGFLHPKPKCIPFTGSEYGEPLTPLKYKYKDDDWFEWLQGRVDNFTQVYNATRHQQYEKLLCPQIPTDQQHHRLVYGSGIVMCIFFLFYVRDMFKDFKSKEVKHTTTRVSFCQFCYFLWEAGYCNSFIRVDYIMDMECLSGGGIAMAIVNALGPTLLLYNIICVINTIEKVLSTTWQQYSARVQVTQENLVERWMNDTVHFFGGFGSALYTDMAELLTHTSFFLTCLIGTGWFVCYALFDLNRRMPWNLLDTYGWYIWVVIMTIWILYSYKDYRAFTFMKLGIPYSFAGALTVCACGFYGPTVLRYLGVTETCMRWLKFLQVVLVAAWNTRDLKEIPTFRPCSPVSTTPQKRPQTTKSNDQKNNQSTGDGRHGRGKVGRSATSTQPSTSNRRKHDEGPVFWLGTDNAGQEDEFAMTPPVSLQKARVGAPRIL